MSLNDQTQTAQEQDRQTPAAHTPPATGESPSTDALVLAAAVAAPLLLAGCGGGGGGGGDAGDTSPTLTFTGIDILVTSDTPAAAVTVNGRTQSGATALGFALNGSPLASDPGKKAASKSYELLAHVDGGDTDRKYTVTLNPAASTIIGGFSKITFAEAKHLAARAGFGASLDDLLALRGMTYDEAVDFIVDHMLDEATQPPLSWYQSDINSNEWEYRRQMKEWWLREIVRTPNPFTERMVAFWGNHFVVNIDDIEEPSVGWAWQAFLRKHAGGNLRTFAHDMCLHPAMLIYLDNRSNKRVAPPGSPNGTPKLLPSNENFGRELLELFLLGEGKGYTEDDVLAVARAFTGHNLNSLKQYEFYTDRHDPSNLVILGSTSQPFGALVDGDGKHHVYDVIDRIMATGMSDGSPRTAKLVVEKMWIEFIGTDPQANLTAVNQLAATLYSGGWELKPLYKALLRRSEFKAGGGATAYDLREHKLLKSPVELICGFYRSLGLTPSGGHWDWKVYDAGAEDQDPFAPPIVKGWLGGSAWINAKTLLERFGHMTNYGWEFNESTVPASLRQGYEEVLLNAKRVFAPPTVTWDPFANLLRALFKDPAYNLK